MMSPFQRFQILVILVVIAVLLSACNMPNSNSTAMPSMSVTDAYKTIEARLTEDAPAAATVDQSPTPPNELPTSTLTPSTSPTLSNATETSALTANDRACDRAAAGSPIDVTIPDDTVMKEGENFTKIWRLRNTGTCTWNSSYSVTFFSGEQMGAPANIPLSGEVAPGQTVDIAVDFVAPRQSGTYQGNWKLKNAENVLFGIGPNGTAPFWVRIVVLITPTPTLTAPTATPSTTSTPTLTSSPTSTPSPTATQPAVQAEGTLSLVPSNSVDLDQLNINPPEGSDLFYDSNQDGQHILLPQAGSVIAVFGSQQPPLNACQSAEMSSNPIVVDTLLLDTYLCYRTGAGLPGRARLIAYNIDTYSIELSALTWAVP